MTNNLVNNTVFITGASSGIGYATALQFAKLGANLIITARRYPKLVELKTILEQQYNIKVYAQALDVCDKNQVTQLITDLPEEFKNIDILVNNAGLALGSELIQSGNINNWEIMIDTNIKGLLYLIRHILPGMIKRQNGHIVNLGSMAGRHVYSGGNVYNATKFAVKAISEAIRLDVLGHNIRVTEIAPGAVHTEFSEVRWAGDKERADEFYNKFQPLNPDDIADNIIYAVTRPKHVNIAEMVIYSTSQAGSTIKFKDN
jgi:3-hydroxy acid dehydrogenase/malonic semialdehyde reductase